MSKASKVINIFIFVFAIVVVVFGVLLFQKREQITQARSDIAATVEKVSRQIDSSATIPADDLKINKTPAEVKEAMVKLDSAVDKIVKQRNAIAENLTEVTNTVLEKAFYDEGDEPYIVEDGVIAGDYRTYDKTLTDIKTHIGERMEYFYVRDKHLSDFMSKDGANLGMPARNYAFSADNAKLAKSLNELIVKTNDTVERMKAFRGHIVTIFGQISPDATKPDLDSQEYNRLLRENVTTVEEYVNRHNQLIKDNEELRIRVERAEIGLGTAEENTANFKRVAEEATQKLADAEKEIRRLRIIIDPTGSGEENELNINFTVLKDLVGKVVYVNEQYGYITVDIGSESNVVRSSGERLRAAVPEGAILTVATSLDPDTAKYVCKAQVIRIRANASVATILASPGGTFDYPKVGDVVFFSQTDIATMKAAHDEAMRKKAEERAAAEQAQSMQDFNDIMTGEDESDDSGIDSGDDFLEGLDDDSGINSDDDSGDEFDLGDE